MAEISAVFRSGVKVVICNPSHFVWYSLPRNFLVIASEIKSKIILTSRFEIQVENNRIVKGL